MYFWLKEAQWTWPLRNFFQLFYNFGNSSLAQKKNHVTLIYSHGSQKEGWSGNNFFPSNLLFQPLCLQRRWGTQLSWEQPEGLSIPFPKPLFQSSVIQGPHTGCTQEKQLPKGICFTILPLSDSAGYNTRVPAHFWMVTFVSKKVTPNGKILQFQAEKWGCEQAAPQPSGCLGSSRNFPVNSTHTCKKSYSGLKVLKHF